MSIGSIKAQTGLLSLWLSIFFVSIAAGQTRPLDPSRFIEAVRTFGDQVLKHGRDSFGPKKTPLFIDGINVETLEPVVWKCKGEEWIISNLANHQTLLRTLDGLSSVTGDVRYRKASEEAVGYAFANLRSPNGLLYRGGHSVYDAASERIVGEGPTHKLKFHFPHYRLMVADRSGW